jgi:hypothetical protein
MGDDPGLVQRLAARLFSQRAARHDVKTIAALGNAPGPSPWYLRGATPPAPGFVWSGAGESDRTAGATVLSNREGPVLILDFHNYVSVVDSETMLVWHQRHVTSGPTAPVVLRLFRLKDLRPLDGDLASLCESMRRAEAPFAASDPPLDEMSIPTTVANERRELVFLPLLRGIEELLILCRSSAIHESPPGEGNNLALLVAHPARGAYQLFPQDWFNSAGLDYSYQWVTRVARDPRTGRIHGEGVRISPFVLDESLRRTS